MPVVLVPDCRSLDQNFHDVMVVDMGDLPESEVSIPELSDLARKWPPAVIAHMRWRQPELEEMKQAARLQYRKKQPAQCDFCSTMIRCDMYRHVARCHLDLAQLWRCPVSWCTVWKGAPQDLMDHVRYAHRVPEEVQSIKLETLIPPWTVTRKVYTESLTFYCLVISACRWRITTGCTRRASLMSHSARTICHSCALYCPCLRLRWLKGDRRSLDVRQWGIRRMLWAPRLDRPDVRLLADA